MEKVEDRDVSIGFGEWRSPVTWTRAVSADCWLEADCRESKREWRVRKCEEHVKDLSERFVTSERSRVIT